MSARPEPWLVLPCLRVKEVELDAFVLRGTQPRPLGMRSLSSSISSSLPGSLPPRSLSLSKKKEWREIRSALDCRACVRRSQRKNLPAVCPANPHSQRQRLQPWSCKKEWAILRMNTQSVKSNACPRKSIKRSSKKQNRSHCPLTQRLLSKGTPCLFMK